MSEYTLEVDPMGHPYFRRPDKTTISSAGALDELNALLARAKAAEAELARFLSTISFFPPEMVELPAKSSSSQPTKVETISAAQAKASEIPANTLCVQPDWQRVRIDAAIAAMQGILAGNLYRELLSGDGWPEQRAAFLAVDHASMLTEELKKEKAE